MLVVTEVALASLLLAGSGLLLEGFARIQSRRTGFVPDRVMTFWVRPPNSMWPQGVIGEVWLAFWVVFSVQDRSLSTY